MITYLGLKSDTVTVPAVTSDQNLRSQATPAPTQGYQHGPYDILEGSGFCLGRNPFTGIFGKYDLSLYWFVRASYAFLNSMAIFAMVVDITRILAPEILIRNF